MKKMIIAAVTALAFVLPCASAQTAQSAPRAPVDPEAIVAVQELLVSMKYREMMQKSFAQIDESLPAMMMEGVKAAINSDSKLSAAQKKSAFDKAAKEVPEMAAQLRATFSDPKLIDELLVEMVPMYARHFSAAEIRELAAFYKTPLGAKMIATMPQIMNESMQLSQKVVLPRVSEAIQALSEGKGKGCCGK